jgi:hypothetical protein
LDNAVVVFARLMCTKCAKNLAKAGVLGDCKKTGCNRLIIMMICISTTFVKTTCLSVDMLFSGVPFEGFNALPD